MSIGRVKRAFESGRTAFMPYAALGYPTPESSIETVKSLVDSGADLLELGVPFSDPLADGATIQAATQKAIENKVSLSECINLVARLREDGVDVPILFMSYFNPILSYGVERCAADCAAVGVDGFIVPDLPPEEAGEMEAACQGSDLALVFLLSPTSPPKRVEMVSEKSTGFVYLVSLTGVTGERKSLPEGLSAFVHRVRKITDKPLAVGFGIGNGAQAAEVAKIADGVIVGSALVKRAGESNERVKELAVEIVTSMLRKSS